jgi:hypothetical protein
MGDVSGAIEVYHKALGIKSDDTFTVEMLNRALQEFLESSEFNNILINDEAKGKSSPSNSLAAGFSAMKTRSQKTTSLESSFETDESCIEMAD